MSLDELIEYTNSFRGFVEMSKSNNIQQNLNIFRSSHLLKSSRYGVTVYGKDTVIEIDDLGNVFSSFTLRDIK